jgi:23S rRNA U2552 (ribose-2'-O)-methylase RlmE/FtsJ
MGYMTFTQLAESQHNEPLATGFANGLETFLAGSPRVMLFGNSYGNIDRDLGNDPGAWLHLVQQRIAARKVSGVRELLGMDTTNMVLPHYAEAWTLAGLLAKQPARFADLVLALREEKDAVKEIERIYGWDEKKLADEWHKQVLATK